MLAILTLKVLISWLKGCLEEATARVSEPFNLCYGFPQVSFVVLESSVTTLQLTISQLAQLLVADVSNTDREEERCSGGHPK